TNIVFTVHTRLKQTIPLINSIDMMTDNKKVKCDTSVSTHSEEVLENGKETVPGQQIGLYGEADKKNVEQVVKILNPDKNSMESRG
ncbi:MAG: hypothetical protein LUE99_11575, partial [Bacteroides sp.]|nr:hypothetical protein [Bacteroides sp.]